MPLSQTQAGPRLWIEGERQLENIIQRAQCFGSSRMVALQSLQSSGQLDFAASVERVMAITDCEPRVGSELSLEEIDDTLDQVAVLSSFSSANLREAVREKYGHLSSANELLSRVFARLKSFEAKWMIRMMFKSYSPAHIPDMLAMSHFHFLLPDLLRFQDSISAAVELLSAPYIQHMPARPTVDTYSELRKVALLELMPRVGVMVARSDYEKARSIKHCCQLAGSRQMSVERKYDGEYCQVHVRLDISGANIQIFSKSGRDSTQNRAGIHQESERIDHRRSLLDGTKFTCWSTCTANRRICRHWRSRPDQDQDRPDHSDHWARHPTAWHQPSKQASIGLTDTSIHSQGCSCSFLPQWCA